MTKNKGKLTLDKTQPIFIGMDVHKKTWSICLIHCDQIVGRVSLKADFEQLEKYLNRFDGYTIYSVYEAGFCGFHLHYQLTSAGILNIVTPTNKMPIMSGDKVKTDRRDSLKLATYLAKGLLKKINIPTKEQIDRRQIIRTREQLKKKKARAINQIKSLVIQHGIQLDSVGMSDKTVGYLSTLKMPPMIRMSVDIHVEQLKLIKGQIKTLEKEYQKIESGTEKYSKNYLLLKSIPGIGPLIAASLANEIGNWNRFNNEKQVSAYFGLTPSEYSSGGNVRRGRITGQGNSILRAFLVQASWKLIEKDPVMKEFFERITKQTGSKKKAIIAVARKLICRIFSMMKNDMKYELGMVM